MELDGIATGSERGAIKICAPRMVQTVAVDAVYLYCGRNGEVERYGGSSSVGVELKQALQARGRRTGIYAIHGEICR